MPLSHRIVLSLSILVIAAPALAATNSFELTVLPPEHKRMADPQTGTELLFLATGPGEDSNLYCEQRSWLADSSLILFHLGRKNGGLTGYLTKTGELVRLGEIAGQPAVLSPQMEENQGTVGQPRALLAVQVAVLAGTGCQEQQLGARLPGRPCVCAPAARR